MKITTKTLIEKKRNNEKITMLTAYDYNTAKILEETFVDMVLVGDSLGMVVLGYEDTTKVTMEDMLHHTKAVTRATKNSFVVADMPFLSYHLGINESVRNAGRLIQEGNADAVKLEGGSEVVDVIKKIVDAKIPVVGHLGITPQSVLLEGGYIVKNSLEECNHLLSEALLLEQAGICSLVLECVPHKIAELISKELKIPVIGIGSGVNVDGQVLVINDILGSYHGTPAKFVKHYSNINEITKEAVTNYIKEVKEASFPTLDHSFKIKKEVLLQFKEGLKHGDN